MFHAIVPSLTSPNVTAFELIKRTVKETIDDDCASIAAQLAYYFALALFPARNSFLCRCWIQRHGLMI